MHEIASNSEETELEQDIGNHGQHRQRVIAFHVNIPSSIHTQQVGLTYQLLPMVIPHDGSVLILSFTFGLWHSIKKKKKKSNYLCIGTKLVLVVKNGIEFYLSCMQLCR